jgi:hypothetical protein
MDYHKLIHTLASSANTVAILAFGAFAVSGCGSSTDAVVTTCNVPSDQSMTISGKWAVVPVPIAFHSGDWAPSEMAAITAAADTWNQFYGTSQNFQLIDYGGSSSSPRTSTISVPADPCSNPMLSGSKFNSPIVIYKDSTTWPASYGSQLIALTRFCTPSGSSSTGTIPNMFSAVIEVNYVNYFTTNLVPDLQSILLHELGHLAGLNHSCNGGANPGFPECANNTTYASAVMAPVFSFAQGTGQGEQKRALTANDEGRANCLYDGQLTTN